jgi:hypothetical protein
MRKVKLSKISGGQALRTESIIGFAPREPEIGISYQVLGDSLINPGQDIRQFVTSMVQNIETTENGYILKTLNSVYKVEFLKDEADDEDLQGLPTEG